MTFEVGSFEPLPVDPNHDVRCESEFIHGPMAWSPCRCAERLGTPQSDADLDNARRVANT